jgi:titin
LNEDSDAILTVELNRENQEVEWYKDDVFITNEPKRRIYKMDKIYTLRLGEINPKDGNGRYSFKVKNLETSGVLTVIEKPIVVVAALKDKIVVENKTAKFVVEFNKPEILSKLVWLKNNEEITDFSEHYEQQEDGTKYFLLIKKAQFDDEAKYTVRVVDSDASSSANLSVTEGPLEVTKHLGDFQLKENQTAKFECEFNKANVPVTWFKNGEEIDTNNNKKLKISVDGKRHTLVINKCDPSDAGKYTVKTTGPFTTCIFTVDEIPVEFNKPLADVRVKEKETAVFTCESNKENAPVKWYKDGIELYEGENKKYKYVTNGNKYSLEILDAQLKDITNYAVSIRGKTCTANLDVEEVPVKILRPLTDVSVFEKEEIHLECEFETPNLDAVWHKDNTDAKLMLGIDRCYSKVNGTVHYLTILGAKLDDMGSYSCTAKLSKTSCNVNVKETPVAVVKPLDNQEVVEKQTATFACTLNKPRLKVTWYRGDTKLTETDRIQFAQEGKVYKLMISNAQLDDKSSYGIKVDDVESKAQLNVKDAPNKVKTTISDKDAVEEDDVAFFEIELVKQIKETDPIKWTFNGRRVDLKGNKYAVEARGNKSKLLIKNIRLEDEGNYTVEVNNSSSTATLTVNGNYFSYISIYFYVLI